MLTCSACRHFHEQPRPPGPVDLRAPTQGLCMERLHSVGLIAHTAAGPQLAGCIGYYPSLPANFAACGIPRGG